MRRFSIFSLCLLMTIAFSSCGRKETSREKAQKDPAKNTEKLGEAMKQSGPNTAQKGGKIVAADQALLSAALPQIDGWNREEPEYEKNAFAGVESASIHCRYTRSASELVSVKISDSGTASAMLVPLRMFFQLNQSHEDERRYDKVSTVNGVPIIEKFDKRSQRAEYTFIVRDRYIVDLGTAAAGGFALLRDFFGRMNLAALQ